MEICKDSNDIGTTRGSRIIREQQREERERGK